MNTADLPTEKNKKLSDFVTDQLYQALKPLGFKRKDRHYLYRDLEESIQVINVRADRYIKNSVSASLGIYYPAIMKLLRRDAPTKKPHEIDFTLRSSIGQWLEPALDTGWTYVEKDKLADYKSRFVLDQNVYTDKETLTRDFVEAISQKGIRFFEKFQSLNDCKMHLAITRYDEHGRYYILAQGDIQKILQQK